MTVTEISQWRLRPGKVREGEDQGLDAKISLMDVWILETEMAGVTGRDVGYEREEARTSPGLFKI